VGLRWLPRCWGHWRSVLQPSHRHVITTIMAITTTTIMAGIITTTIMAITTTTMVIITTITTASGTAADRGADPLAG
jgi:hypothetical protein